MSKEEALYRSLASCGATIIVFVGIAHEFVGDIVFPWGPSFLGGPVGWHAAGLLGIVVGLLLLGGTLQLIRFPVVGQSLLIAAMGAFFLIVAAVMHGQFHMFALAAFLAALATGYFHHKASALTTR